MKTTSALFRNADDRQIHVNTLSLKRMKRFRCTTDVNVYSYVNVNLYTYVVSVAMALPKLQRMHANKCQCHARGRHRSCQNDTAIANNQK